MRQRGFWWSIGYACRGLLFAVRTQRNLRWHVAAAAGVLVMAARVGLSRTELSVLYLVIGLVLCAEILNTAVELTIDMINITEHPVARLVKDVAAGAVLVTVCMALGVGWLLLGPHLGMWP